MQKPALSVVVARYKEDVAWLNQLPADARVTVYNKGPDIAAGTLRDGITVHALPNHGRESHTFLYHLRNHFDAQASEFTVFTQGDPFEHSPGFLQLAKIATYWRDVQPLSVQWVEANNIPPRHLVGSDLRDWVSDIPIRTEHYSLHTWAPVSFFDQGAWGIGNQYRIDHRLPSGYTILEHFFELCGLQALADSVKGADVGVFSYGAIFGVRNSRIEEFLQQARLHLEKMELLTRADPNYGYIFERCWLHLFGEPVLRFPALRSEALDRLLDSESFRDAQAAQQAAEAAAIADDVAPQATPAQSDAELAAIRRTAYDAWGRGKVAEAQALLNRALLADPMNHEVLSDLAAMAFQGGEPERAIPYARRALLVQPAHAASLFTLAMCLARTGRSAEALELFGQLASGPTAQAFREETPDLAALADAEAARLRAATQPA